MAPDGVPRASSGPIKAKASSVVGYLFLRQFSLMAGELARRYWEMFVSLPSKRSYRVLCRRAG